MSLHPFCPLCHRQSVAVVPLGDLGYGVGCRGTDPRCYYLIRPFQSKWTEEYAIRNHNRNVRRLKLLVIESYDEGRDWADNDPEAVSLEEWLKGKGL